MIIKKLVLKGYKRFFLNNIKYLEYTPSKRVEIILGRNGCGKSSLLKQLNMMPINKKDFEVDGYKGIVIEEGDDIIEIVSSSNKHGFKINGVEYNVEGNITKQYELIEKRWGIDIKVMDVLLGYEKLSGMDISKRKFWLNRLSVVDVEYGYSVYKKMKELVNGISSYIKIEHSRLEKYSGVEDKLEDIRRKKSMLLKFKESVIQKEEVGVVSIDSIASCNRLLEDLLTQYEQEKNKNGLTPEEIEEEIKKIKLNIDYELKEIEKIEQVTNAKKTRECIRLLEEEIKKLESYKHLLKDIDNYSIMDMAGVFNKVKPDMLAVLNNLIGYKDIKDKDIFQVTEIVRKLDIAINKNYKVLELLETDIKFMEDRHNDEYKITCEKCGNMWYNGYNEGVYKINIARRDEIREKVNKYNEQFKEYNNLLGRIAEMDKCYTQLMYIKNKNEHLNNLFNQHIGSFKDKTPEEIISFIDQLGIELHRVSGLANKVSDLELLRQELNFLLNVKIVNNSVDARKKEIDRLTILKNKKEEELKVSKNIIYLKNKVESISKELYNKLIEYKKNIYITTRNEHIEELNNLLNVEILKLDEEESTVKEYLINKKKLDEYKEQEKVYKQVMKELSPVDGLLAEHMSYGINGIIEDMNSVISKIWTYDMEILPYKIEEDENLTFKLRVKINNDVIVEDISKLSSSLKEIIDLSFNIVVRKYLSLDLPMYLDEFGASFDKEHREKTYDIMSGITSYKFDQFFIINHYDNLYGNMKECSYVVLDENNIELKNIDSYNNNLIIRR